MSTYTRVFGQIEQYKRDTHAISAKQEAFKKKCIEALQKASKEIQNAIKEAHT